MLKKMAKISYYQKNLLDAAMKLQIEHEASGASNEDNSTEAKKSSRNTNLRRVQFRRMSIKLSDLNISASGSKIKENFVTQATSKSPLV